MRIFTKYFNFILVLFICRGINSNAYKTRNRRPYAKTLVFPHIDPTVVTLIYGIGIPVEDLAYEFVLSGYVLKAQYYLPIRAEQLTPNYLKPQKIHRRNAVINRTLTTNSFDKVHTNYKSKRQSTHHGSSYSKSNLKSQQQNTTEYRWVVYKAIELALNSSNFPGKVCMLRCICEHAAAPMHYGGGLLAELLHIILTPSTSRDDFSNPLDKEYLNAESIGYSGQNCEEEFKSCTKSPMDLVTVALDLASLYF